MLSWFASHLLHSTRALNCTVLLSGRRVCLDWGTAPPPAASLARSGAPPTAEEWRTRWERRARGRCALAPPPPSPKLTLKSEKATPGSWTLLRDKLANSPSVSVDTLVSGDLLCRRDACRCFDFAFPNKIGRPALICRGAGRWCNHSLFPLKITVDLKND